MKTEYNNKRVRKLETIRNEQFENQVIGWINAANLTEDKKVVARKDAHLIALALRFPGPICSFEVRARHVFQELAAEYKQLNKIEWIDPSKDPEQTIAWLQRGAPIESPNLLQANE